LAIWVVTAAASRTEAAARSMVRIAQSAITPFALYIAIVV